MTCMQASIDEKRTLGIQWVWLFAVSGSKVTKLGQLPGTHHSLTTLFCLCDARSGRLAHFNCKVNKKW